MEFKKNGHAIKTFYSVLITTCLVFMLSTNVFATETKQPMSTSEALNTTNDITSNTTSSTPANVETDSPTNNPSTTESSEVIEYELPDEDVIEYELPEDETDTSTNNENTKTKSPTKTKAPSTSNQSNTNQDTNQDTHSSNENTVVKTDEPVATEAQKTKVKLYFYNSLGFENIKIICKDSKSKLISSSKGDKIKSEGDNSLWYIYSFETNQDKVSISYKADDVYKTDDINIQTDSNHWFIINKQDGEKLSTKSFDSKPSDDEITQTAVTEFVNPFIPLEDDGENTGTIEPTNNDSAAGSVKFLGKQYNDKTTEKKAIIIIAMLVVIIGILSYYTKRKFKVKIKPWSKSDSNQVDNYIEYDEDEIDNDIVLSENNKDFKNNKSYEILQEKQESTDGLDIVLDDKFTKDFMKKHPVEGKTEKESNESLGLILSEDEEKKQKDDNKSDDLSDVSVTLNQVLRNNGKISDKNFAINKIKEDIFSDEKDDFDDDFDIEINDDLADILR